MFSHILKGVVYTHFTELGRSIFKDWNLYACEKPNGVLYTIEKCQNTIESEVPCMASIRRWTAPLGNWNHERFVWMYRERIVADLNVSHSKKEWLNPVLLEADLRQYPRQYRLCHDKRFGSRSKWHLSCIRCGTHMQFPIFRNLYCLVFKMDKNYTELKQRERSLGPLLTLGPWLNDKLALG